jgi:aminopeptidase YwaD
MITSLVATLTLGLYAPAISPATVKSHLEYFASDELEGRMTLSKGEELAAQYAAAEFKKYGLDEGPNKGYFHRFDVTVNQRATAKNVCTFEGADGRQHALKLSETFVPLLGSTNLKTVRGDVVFVGYGFDDEDWNDYAGVDVSGKVVMMLRGAPEGKRFRANGAKARVAVEKGASGVILVAPALPPLARGHGIAGSLSSVAVAITDKQFEALTGLNAESARAAKAPASRLLGLQARLITETEPNAGKAINIVGYLPGNDPVLKNEFIIIGAHYDHLGWGDTGSRTGVSAIHYGADDNGSGSAGVLAVAEYLAKQKTNRRTIIFQLYSAEELGLLGSSAWAKDHPEIIAKTTAMLNMDMIGTVRFNDIYVFGTSTSNSWDKILDTVKVPGLNLVYRGHLRGDSDQASFGRRNVPALFFHSMLTDVYHTERDTLDRVNFKGAALVCEAVAATAMAVDKLPKLEWNSKANLRGRSDDRVIPTGPGKSERQGG